MRYYSYRWDIGWLGWGCIECGGDDGDFVLLSW